MLYTWFQLAVYRGLWSRGSSPIHDKNKKEGVACYILGFHLQSIMVSSHLVAVPIHQKKQKDVPSSFPPAVCT